MIAERLLNTIWASKRPSTPPVSEVSTITYEAVQLARGEMGQRTRWRAPSGRAGVRDSRYPSHQR